MIEINFYKDSNKSPIEDFLNSLTDEEVKKVFFVFDLIEKNENISKKFLKKLKGTDDIWEIRVNYRNKSIRFLGFFENDKIIILNHVFIKKTNKIPIKEIKIAEERKKEYLRSLK